jgi:pentatricopeptide repeat protein
MNSTRPTVGKPHPNTGPHPLRSVDTTAVQNGADPVTPICFNIQKIDHTIEQRKPSKCGLPPPVYPAKRVQHVELVQNVKCTAVLPPGGLGTSGNSTACSADRETRNSLLRTMSSTSSPEEAWEAYRALLSSANLADSNLRIPYAHLHHLAHLLASSKPRTRTLFLRLLSVLSYIHKAGGDPHLWEWNALIDCAGKGWRKARPEDFTNALDIFNDMVARKSNKGDTLRGADVEPDIVTYTTLLNIASRTLSPSSLQHATSLLKSSRLPPNRITHLSLLKYFTETRQLSGIRTTLSKMKEQGLEIGLDGVNSVLWAFAYNNQMDVASTIYRVLRHSVLPELFRGDNDINAAIQYLADVQGLLIPTNMIPNKVTYTIMIQTYAYHGDLIRSLQVFMDMLSSQNMESLPSRERPQNYVPTVAAFRTIFLGFTRHGKPPSSKRSTLQPESAWTLENLYALFKAFLQLPSDVRVSERVIYWILIAFGKTSGYDARKLRNVWAKLEARFGGGWGGRLERFRQKIAVREGNR